MSDYLEPDERELKRLAEAATQISDPQQWFDRITTRWYNTHDQRLITTMTPKKVLGLLETIDRLRSQAEDEAYRQMEMLSDGEA